MTRHTICVSLGTNVNKEQNLPRALRLLSELCDILAVSSAYESLPEGPAGQPNFLNAAVVVQTELPADRFRSEALRPMERRMGRVRTADRYEPRPIDADITLCGSDIFDLPGDRHIPDPALLEQLHIALPLAEIAGDMIHPESGETIDDIVGRLQDARQSGPGPTLWLRTDILTARITARGAREEE